MALFRLGTGDLPFYPTDTEAIEKMNESQITMQIIKNILQVEPRYPQYMSLDFQSFLQVKPSSRYDSTPSLINDTLLWVVNLDPCIRLIRLKNGQ